MGSSGWITGSMMFRSRRAASILAFPVRTKMGCVALGIMDRASQLDSISALDWFVEKARIRYWVMVAWEKLGVGRGRFNSGRRKRVG